jgi:hypothetical protein
VYFNINNDKNDEMYKVLFEQQHNITGDHISASPSSQEYAINKPSGE